MLTKQISRVRISFSWREITKVSETIMKNILSVLELGGKEILTGLQGKTLYLKFLENISPQSEPQPLFLDFAGVIATGSFFREAVLQLRDYCIARRFNLYPVVANAGAETLEELRSLFEMSPDAIFVCDLDKKGDVKSAKLVGVLEEKQEITFDALKREKEADAPTLAQKYQENSGIGTTGWNNRLTALANKGLIAERRKGRSKIYSPILEVS